MAAHAPRGHAAEAAKTYQACRRTLREELGVHPSPITDAAYRSLLFRARPADNRRVLVPT
jgi:DNA-binding SARP family transcriptional activator